MLIRLKIKSMYLLPVFEIEPAKDKFGVEAALIQ